MFPIFGKLINSKLSASNFKTLGGETFQSETKTGEKK